MLYNPRPGEGWRYAIYTEPRAVMDGRLLDLPAEASATEAQTRMQRQLGGFFGGTYRLQWREDKPGWWTGDVEPAP